MKRIAIPVVLAACLGMVALAAPAQAKNFRTTPATLPLTYRYAACVFAQDAGSADAQVASCQDLRSELENASERILFDFHKRNRLMISRQMLKGFDELESEAKDAWSENKTVPVVILNYLDCLGSRQMEGDTYSQGNAVDWVSIEPECRKAPVEGQVYMTRAAMNRAAMLFHRFRPTGRAVNIEGRMPETGYFRYGFLGLNRLPADGEAIEE